MAASLAQRVGIWTIAVALTLGTIVSFVVMIVANDNAKLDEARLNELMAEYEVKFGEYQDKIDAQARELSKVYYDGFIKYESRVGEFSSDIDELETKDLKAGTGEELTDESNFSAYYIGWNPKGKVFDSSINKEEKLLSPPFQAGPGRAIDGWIQGVDGMKIGGVRELTIPANLAYGDVAQSEDIPANTPLKFVVMVIPTPEEIPYPQPSDELIRLYQQVQGGI